jgi:hypothetical protein
MMHDRALSRAHRAVIDGAGTASSFESLVANCEGMYPSDIRDILVAEGARFTALLRDAETAPMGSAACPQGPLALPHPQDSEWRFSDGCAEALARRAVRSAQGQPVLCLGVPMVAIAAARAGARSLYVMGEDNVITRGLIKTIGSEAVYGPPVEGQAGAVVLDPPWYPEAYREMLAIAVRASRVGATLFVGAPASGSRPEAEADRELMAQIAASLGLERLAIEPESLGYRTPMFELNALRAAGVGAALHQWRRGDLFLFRKVITKSGPSRSPPPCRAAFELTLRGVRLRLSAEPSVDVAGPLSMEVFPHVSTRAVGRGSFNLWSSGNRALAVDRDDALDALLVLAERAGVWRDGLNPEASSPFDQTPLDPIQPLIHHLSQLVDLEVLETTAYAGDDGWDRSVDDARFLNSCWRAFRRDRHGRRA